VIPELEPDEFVSFLADLWGERGWETTIQKRANGTYFVVGERGDGRRGVLFVFPTPESHVSGQHLRRFVTLCRKKGVDVGVVATQGAYDPEARKIARAKGIHLLDRSTLEGTVEEGGFRHVLRTYAGGGPLDPLLGRLRAAGVPVPESLPVSLPFDADEVGARVRGKLGGYGGDDGGDDGDGASTKRPPSDGDDPDGEDAAEGDDGGRFGALPISRRAALSVLLVAMVLSAAATVVGPALGVGGLAGVGGGNGATISAVSTAGEEATLRVRWNAKTASAITVGGARYEAPPNETFVVVRMNVTNVGDSPERLSQRRLALGVAGERYGYQPLVNETGFPAAGLFAPGESREVWTLFSVPADAESGTLLVLPGEGAPSVRFRRDAGMPAEATASG
jgi:hypothetical protein